MRGRRAWVIALLVAAACGQGGTRSVTTTTGKDGGGTQPGGSAPGGASATCPDGVGIWMRPVNVGALASLQAGFGVATFSGGTSISLPERVDVELLPPSREILIANLPFPSGPVSVSLPIVSARAEGGPIAGDLEVCTSPLQFGYAPGQIDPARCAVFVDLDLGRSLQPESPAWNAAFLPQFAVRFY